MRTDSLKHYKKEPDPFCQLLEQVRDYRRRDENFCILNLFNARTVGSPPLWVNFNPWTQPFLSIWISSLLSFLFSQYIQWIDLKSFNNLFHPWQNIHTKLIKRTVSEILKWTSMQRLQCPIYNGTLETLIWSKIKKIPSFFWLEISVSFSFVTY